MLRNQELMVARSLKPCLPTVLDQVAQVMLAHGLWIRPRRGHTIERGLTGVELLGFAVGTSYLAS